MKKGLVNLLGVFVSVVGLKAQAVHETLSFPHSLNAYSKHQVDGFSLFTNVASLAQLRSKSLALFGVRRFLINEMGNYGVALSIPAREYGNFGLRTKYAGFPDFNETEWGLCYARELGSKMDLGVCFDYYNINISHYGRASVPGFEIGGMLHLTESLHTGFLIKNPVGGKFGKDNAEKIPSVYSFGYGYDASKKFHLAFAVEKIDYLPVKVIAGIQYQYLKELILRFGISTESSSYWFAVGLKLRSCRLEISVSNHPQLGISPGLGLLFQSKQKDEAEDL